jgi:hypothetical protein
VKILLDDLKDMSKRYVDKENIRRKGRVKERENKEMVRETLL